MEGGWIHCSCATEAKKLLVEVENESSGEVSWAHTCALSILSDASSISEGQKLICRRSYQLTSKHALCDIDGARGAPFRASKRWFVQYAPSFSARSQSTPDAPSSGRRLLYRTVDPQTSRVYLYDPATKVITVDPAQGQVGSAAVRSTEYKEDEEEEEELPSSVRHIIPHGEHQGSHLQDSSADSIGEGLSSPVSSSPPDRIGNADAPESSIISPMSASGDAGMSASIDSAEDDEGSLDEEKEETDSPNGDEDCRLRQVAAMSPSKSIATGQIQRRAARISGTPTIADGSSRWAEEADKVNGSFDSRCCE